jgi:twitching motility protein PilI
MVDEVLGFRRFTDAEFTGDVPPTILRCERYLAGAFKRGTEVWPVFTLRNLLESTEFLQAAAS